MNVTIIQGSPRKNGNTATLVAAVAGRLHAGGVALSSAYLHGMELAPCNGCMACQKVEDAPGCVIKDDMQALFQQLLTSDCIVFASPVYCYGFSAQMKLFLDRISCLIKFGPDGAFVSLLAGKSCALLVTAACDPYAGADLVVETYNRIAGAYGMSSLGYIVATDVQGKADLATDSLQARAANLAAAMVAALSAPA